MDEKRLMIILLDVYDYARKAEDALDGSFSALERAVHPMLMDQQRIAMAAVQMIQRILTDAVGGQNKLEDIQDNLGRGEPT